MSMKKTIALLMAAMLAFTALAACADSKEPTGPDAGEPTTSAPASQPPSESGATEPVNTGNVIASSKDTLTFGGRDLVSFNLFNTSQSTDIYFDGLVICESLITMNNDFVYEPQLCEDYKISDDGMVYTFNIRPGVTFHNGQPLTAADVVYSLEKTIEAPTGADVAAAVDKIETPDDMTVVVTLKAPSVSFLFNLYSFSCVVPDGIFESGYDWEAHPIGTGAYEFVSYVPGDKLVLKAYEGYYTEGLPRIKNFVYKIIADTSTQAMSLESGQLDYLLTDATNYKLLESNPDLLFKNYATINATMGFTNIEMAPFDDINVRYAVNHAVDREALAKVLGEAGYTPATSFSSPAIYGYNDMPGYEYDVELAKDYLSKSKYSGDELSFAITTREPAKTIATFLQESFRNIGIDVAIDIVDASAFGAGLVAKEFAYSLTGFGLGILASANNYIYQTGGPFNFGYSNSVVDENFQIAAETTDEATRLAAYLKIDEEVQKDAPYMNLLWSNYILAYKKDLVVDDALYYACGDMNLGLKYFYFK